MSNCFPINELIEEFFTPVNHQLYVCKLCARNFKRHDQHFAGGRRHLRRKHKEECNYFSNRFDNTLVANPDADQPRGLKRKVKVPIKLSFDFGADSSFVDEKKGEDCSEDCSDIALTDHFTCIVVRESEVEQLYGKDDRDYSFQKPFPFVAHSSTDNIFNFDIIESSTPFNAEEGVQYNLDTLVEMESKRRRVIKFGLHGPIQYKQDSSSSQCGDSTNETSILPEYYFTPHPFGKPIDLPLLQQIYLLGNEIPFKLSFCYYNDSGRIIAASDSAQIIQPSDQTKENQVHRSVSNEEGKETTKVVEGFVVELSIHPHNNLSDLGPSDKLIVGQVDYFGKLTLYEVKPNEIVFLDLPYNSYHQSIRMRAEDEFNSKRVEAFIVAKCGIK